MTKFFCFVFVPLLVACCPEAVQTLTTKHTIEYRDSIHHIPGGMVETFVPVVTPGDTMHFHTVYRDTAGRAELTFWRDEAGRLRARCEAMDTSVLIRRIKELQTQLQRIETPAPPAPAVAVYKTPAWVVWTFVVQGLLAVIGLLIFTLLKLRPMWLK